MVIKNFICNIHRTFAPDISSVCLLCIMHSVQTDDVFSWTYIQTNNYKTDVYNEINPEQRNKPHRRRPQKPNRWQKRTIYQAAGTTREIGTNHGEHPQWHRATGVYTLAQMERTAKRSRNAAAQPSRFVPRERIASFFARVSRFFDHLQHRLHRSLNYTWFCLVLCSRYTFQSRLKSVERCCLTPATVLGYFKREREM